MAQPKPTGRPKNPTTENGLKEFLKGCAKTDIPRLRKRLLDIALGNVKDEQYDPKTGTLIKKAVPLSVSVDAINAYGKNILSKIEADAKADTNIKVEYSATDAIKEIEAKKRAEYEKKAKAEQEAKIHGKLAAKAIGQN